MRSPYIALHVTCIGTQTGEQFVVRFKVYEKGKFTSPLVNAEKGDMHTRMPWTMYADTTEKDLGAIFDYLHSVKAMESVVNRWTSAVVTKQGGTDRGRNVLAAPTMAGRPRSLDRGPYWDAGAELPAIQE